MIRRSPLIVFCYISGIMIMFLFGIYYHYSTEHQNSAIKIAETYMTTLSTVHHYYAKEISDRAEAGGIKFDADYQKFTDRLPFPGTMAMDLGRELERVDPRLSFSLYSRHPFPWNQDRILNSFEEKSLQAFENGRKKAMAEFENRDGETIVRYAVPVVMTESCVACHNRQEFEFKRVWELGDLRGAQQIAVPVHSTGSLPDNFMLLAITSAVLIGGIGMGLVWPLVRRLELAHEEKIEDFQKLQQAEEQLQEVHLALSHAMPGIAQVDPQGRYTEVNEPYALMLGYQPADLIGKPWEPTIHQNDCPLAVSAYERMLEKGDGEFESRAIRQDGSSFYAHVLMVKRIDSDGQLIGHHRFMRDVTERRQAEETLRSIIDATSSVVSTDFFRSLLRHLASVLQVKYALITECTDSTKTRVKTLAFLQGEEFVENVEYDLAGTPCEQVMQGEFSYYPNNVQALFPMDQDLVTLNAESYIGLPLLNASGNIIGHIAVLHEQPMTMTSHTESLLKIFAGRAGAEVERYRAETALRQSEERLRQIIDLVPHFIFAKDHNGTFILANQAVAEVYGTTLEDLVGKTDADFNPSAAEVEHFHRDDQEVMETGQVKSIQEEQITDSTGHVRFLQTTKIPFVFADTTLPAILGVSIDITQQRQAKEQLEDAYEQLQDLTARLKAAEESERKRIAQELHDEFGQTLTGLKFEMAWLQRRLSEPVSPHTSATLLKKIENMSALSDQLIHMVRQIATSLRPSILDDLGLLPALEWHVQDFQQRTGIACSFSTNFVGNPLDLDNDRATTLFRITQELFTNILRHAQASEVKMSLAQQDSSLVLSVVDNGRGIQDRHTGPSSLGLLGIKERASSFGGEFVIAKSQVGTQATVSIPL